MPKQITSGHFQDFGKVNNLDSELNSAVEFNNLSGFPTIGFNLIIPSGGKIVFEGTFDNITWDKITFRSVSSDGYFMETSTSGSFIGSIAGLRKMRVRVIQAGTANGQVIGRAQRTVSILEGIENSNPPHKFGHNSIRKNIVTNTIQTNTSIWTPNSGRRFVVTDLIIGFSGNTEGKLTIFDEVNTSGNYLFDSFIKVKDETTFTLNLNTPFIGNNINNVLRMTTNSAIELSIVILGYEAE